MREIPKKNYWLLGLLTIITIFMVLYFSNWYKTSKDYTIESSIMTNFLGEIKEIEIDNYILENPDIVIYIASNQDEQTKKFEKKLKNYIIKEEIKGQFIYLDCSNLTPEFISIFQNKYFNGALKKIPITYPNLLFLSDGKVIDVLYKLQGKPDIKDVKKFLEENGVTKDA